MSNSKNFWTSVKEWSNVITIVLSIGGAFAVTTFQAGRLYGTVLDVATKIDEVKKTLEEIKGRLEKLSTDIVLIRTKINDEIVPQLNGERKIRSIAAGAPLVGVPVWTADAHRLNIITSKQYEELRDYPWVIPYKSAGGGERLQDVVDASRNTYGAWTNINVVTKANPPTIDPSKALPPGTRIVIPLQKLGVSEAIQFKEKLDTRKEVSPSSGIPPEKVPLSR